MGSIKLDQQFYVVIQVFGALQINDKFRNSVVTTDI